MPDNGQRAGHAMPSEMERRFECDFFADLCSFTEYIFAFLCSLAIKKYAISCSIEKFLVSLQRFLIMNNHFYALF